MKYFLFVCLLLLMGCTPSPTTWDVTTTQSPARVVKVGEVVTVYSSFAIRENLLYSGNAWNPNAPRTRTALLNNYIIKGFVYGKYDVNGLPYANAVGSFDGFVKHSSNPVDYPFPPEADLITPTMNAARVPQLMDATFDPVSNQVSSSYTMKIIGDGKPIPPPTSQNTGYDVWAQTGFVIFPLSTRQNF